MMSIVRLYLPIERAVLSAYLQTPDPQPADVAGIDIANPVPDTWNETRDGIGPRGSELGSHQLMLENAVARICLECAQRATGALDEASAGALADFVWPSYREDL